MKLFEYKLEDWRPYGAMALLINPNAKNYYYNYYRACIDNGFYIGLSIGPSPANRDIICWTFNIAGHLNGEEINSDPMLVKLIDLHRELYGSVLYLSSIADLELAILNIDNLINKVNNLKAFL